MRILFLPKYTALAASTRQRISQYLPYFEENGWICTVSSLLPDRYLNEYNRGRRLSLWQVALCYLRRLILLRNIRRYDLVFVQYELLPYFPPCLEYLLKWLKVPVVVDYDDAVFHTYDRHPNRIVRWLFRNKIRTVARLATHLITGGPYLTAYFRTIQPRLTQIPTCIDLGLYPPPTVTEQPSFVVGWIGSRSTSRHLLTIARVLDAFTRRYGASVKLIGFDRMAVPSLPSQRFQLVDWSRDQDHALLQDISVGIMPLVDAPFEMGKCGFKLIQYMACGKPFIASPVETNLSLDHHQRNLFAGNEAEWFQALETVYRQQLHFRHVGLGNRRLAEQYYSVQATYRWYLDLFDRLAKPLPATC